MSASFLCVLKKDGHVHRVLVTQGAARCVVGQVPALWSNSKPRPALRDCLEASHSHERRTVHGLHEHKSHEQDVPCGDGNNGCRLRSSGQTFQPIDEPACYRQNL